MDYLFPLNTVTVVASGAAVIAKTLVRNIFHQQSGVGKTIKLRSELLYDEAFSVMKSFFEKASLHTVEDLQTFGNNFVPSPFWVRVIKVTVPLETRLAAGEVFIATLGEDEIQRVVGGREWWQRSADKSGGISGEWISMKRDWDGLEDEDEDDEGKDRVRFETLQRMRESAKKRDQKAKSEVREQQKEWKAREKREEREEGPQKGKGKAEETATPGAPAGPGSDGSVTDDDEASSVHEEPPADEGDESYSPEMDEMRCLLYIHGGAYFFGSINTHRYSIWRYARKMGGRAFAINYRLAPQYPFPCALTDALASYLYLIRPPPGAKHRPVDPAKLTLAGDSAGGGLCLALLCLIRDAGLPTPAGAMLISPWCDLTHSFPSILTNTQTDITPPYGFLFKPSTLWPPPPAEFQERANQSTSLPGLKEAYEKKEASRQTNPFSSLRRTEKKGQVLAKKVSEHGPSAADGGEGKPQDKAEVAKVLKVKVDGKEVEVRDQIQLYATNEQLAYPFVSPVWQPSLGGLPPLYVMCGDKEVLRDEIIYMAHRAANPSQYPLRKALLEANPERTRQAIEYPPTLVHLQIYDDVCHDLPLLSFTTPAKYCYRAISSFAKFVTAGPDDPPPSPVSPGGMRLPGELGPPPPQERPFESLSPLGSPTGSEFLNVPNTPLSSRSDGGSSFRGKRNVKHIPNLESTIYSSTQPFNRPPWVDNMVRERVSISGVVRPLEPASEMSMLQLDPEDIGLIKEGPVRRYMAGKTIWDKRFKRTYERVQKRREYHLKKSMSEEASRIKKRMKAGAQRQASSPSTPSPSNSLDVPGSPRRTESPEQLEPYEGIWDLHGERPPPSSIAARKDTREARKLAHVLDEHYSRLHALHLWSDLQDVERPIREASEGEDEAVASPPGPSI